jgi:peptide/nickel transport system substrate-binding protein
MNSEHQASANAAQDDSRASRQVYSRRAVVRLLPTSAAVLVLAACNAVVPQAPVARPTEASAAAPPVATATPAGPAGVSPSPSPVASVVVAASAPSKPSAQPKSGGILRMGIGGDLLTLDGHVINQNAYDTLWQTFDRLAAYDAQLKPQPMLAESWELSTDLTQIKLNLRKGVQFHSGRDFTSDDVKWNLLRARDPKLQFGSAFGTQSAWFTSIDTPDKYTAILHSNQARPALFDFFEFFNMLDQATMEGPDAKTRVNGTGPFTFGEWAQGDHLRLIKNKNYWQSGQPYFDEILVSIIPDTQAALARLESGGLDALRTPPVRDYTRLKQDANYQAFVNALSGQNYYLGVNTLNPPLDNKKVRQAMNYAVNRNRFAESVMLGTVQTKSLPWGNPSSAAYDAARLNFYNYDLAKAKSLLSEASVSGFEIDMMLINFETEMSDFSNIYQADLATLGIKLNIKPSEVAAWQAAVTQRNYVGAYATAGTYSQMEPITQFTNSGVFNPDSNNEGFKSDAYANLVTSASAEPDSARRKQIYAQLNDLMLDEAFAVPIAAAPPRWVARANLRDVGFTLHEACVWANAWFDG